MASSEIAEFRADMAAVADAVEAIAAELGSTSALLGTQTWRGGAADAWARDWTARRARLRALLRAVLEEQPDLLRRMRDHG
ncbi:hypothetical protein [Bailinhaonella thermotolerans]|uniref:WXG100 family type VII secretion target n=1 Tax=Bailinhaonella thermotolerans TaxID=1070861 RepID=A0A3A4B9P8_9ACTN|nr:hypothetical protein [Bailinhaonella thermotolerans]RJL30918.1 hypothetical protein D5H75_21745 [Bailinhaonella thermotolerans]